MSESVSDYRRRILALGAHLPSATREKSRDLASRLHQDENRYFEDVLRRAVGNAQNEPVDFDLPPNPEAYKQFFVMLEPLAKDEGKFSEFGKKYVVPVLEEDEAGVRDVWMAELISKLSPAAVALILRLAADHNWQLTYPDEDLENLAYLNEETFKTYEEKMLIPALMAQLEELKAQELAGSGISAPNDKERKAPEEEQKGRSSVPAPIIRRRLALEAYVETVSRLENENPSLQEWSEQAKLSAPVLSKLYNTPSFLSELKKALETKAEHREAKTPARRELFLMAAKQINQKQEQIIQQRNESVTRPSRQE